MTTDTELGILWAWLLAMAAGVLVYWAIEFHVVRTIAKWIGEKVATWIWGSGRPR